MRIAIIGTGHVGLVAGSCFADIGNEVMCVDNNEEVIDMLNEGKIPIYEPGLADMISRNVKEERLSFTVDFKKAVQKANVIFITVGTQLNEDNSLDLSNVREVAKDIAQTMNDYKVIVIKSTVPVGTADQLETEIAKHTRHSFAIVVNPEFMKEGAAIDDFLRPDRVVLGTKDMEALEVMRNLYQPFVRSGKPIICMDVKSAEVTKSIANAFLATKISFINEAANFCDLVGADVELVRRGIAADDRIGRSFIYPGVGYGGGCLPKDIKAYVKTGADFGGELKIARAVSEVNADQGNVLFNKIKAYFDGELSGLTFSVWGLSFKPRTNDIRDSPAITLIKQLFEHGATVQAHDPEALKDAAHVFDAVLGTRILLFEKRYDALDGADALVIMTEWNAFREPDFHHIKESLAKSVIFDGRNLYDRQRMKGLNFDYYSIGRPDAPLKEIAL